MRDVYLNFRLPWPAKIAARMLVPGKWWPFEIYLTTIWSDHTYLGFQIAASNRMASPQKQKKQALYIVI
jgi:hypothetical protein